MNYQTITVRSRETGAPAGDLSKSRTSGDLPAVLSRAGKESMVLSISTDELAKAVRRSGVGGIMELVEDGGSKHLGMLKELQWHPVTRKLQHASFQEVSRNQVVHTSVPLIYVGEPAALADKSGQLIKNQETVEIQAKVSNLPDHLTLDISGMQIGDVITYGDIPLPDGCEAFHPDTVVCSLTTPTIVEIETPTAETDALGEAAAEPGDEEEEKAEAAE